MSSEGVARTTAELADDPYINDDEIVTWWGLVIEGYHTTQNRLMGK